MRGLGAVPLLEPLAYPGRVVDRPGLLSGGELLPLRGYDAAGRVPVLAVGSNASPAQLSYKLARAGVSGTVPMVPVRVRGVGVGLSGHISRVGYVSASPWLLLGRESALVVTWLEEAQLAAVDRTELPFKRAFLPADEFPVTVPGDGADIAGASFIGAYVYVNRRGVLGYPDGSLRAGGEQRSVLAGLLRQSVRLRELFGATPESWVRRAREDPELAGKGTAVFRDEGWVVEQPEFAPYVL
ncbi:hypothetical protein [Streptomyces gobiensis]|uniref:hypothetical protein n=1 Tax=Streptomyces gobiensis TaxID=2875706 RepID=UPI001E3D004E|nr:hypothetical protein [Streptomyces gobiensis]UGY95151.1 hypothetical protein test1122_14345 [Streptomyces gobiensis]